VVEEVRAKLAPLKAGPLRSNPNPRGALVAAAKAGGFGS